jgi:hypothetical protein
VQGLLKPENTHRYLAMHRGWMEEELLFELGGGLVPTGKDGALEVNLAFDAALLARFEAEAVSAFRRAWWKFPFAVPAIQSEVRRALKDVDEAAIKVFVENVRKLLMAAPFGSKAVLGVDPGISHRMQARRATEKLRPNGQWRCQDRQPKTPYATLLAPPKLRRPRLFPAHRDGSFHGRLLSRLQQTTGEIISIMSSMSDGGLGANPGKARITRTLRPDRFQPLSV